MCVLAHPLATKTTDPPKPPTTRVTGSQDCHLPLYHLSQGAKVPRCQGAKVPHPRVTGSQTHHSPGPQTCHLPPHHTPDPLTHRCQTTKSHRPPGARVMATRPTRHQTNCHPNTRVTWSHGHRPATNHQIHRCQGAKTTTKILDYQTPSPPTHQNRIHRPTRLTGAPSTGHRVTAPPLTT